MLYLSFSYMAVWISREVFLKCLTIILNLFFLRRLLQQADMLKALILKASNTCTLTHTYTPCPQAIWTFLKCVNRIALTSLSMLKPSFVHFPAFRVDEDRSGPCINSGNLIKKKESESLPNQEKPRGGISKQITLPRYCAWPHTLVVEMLTIQQWMQ